MTEEERASLLADCRLAAELARREGVTLCMECHKKTFTQELEDTLLLMKETHSPHFRMYWQPFQWQTEEENRSYAKAIAPYTEHIHGFQWKGEDTFPLSEGIDEWRTYLKEFSTPRTLLLEFMPDGRIESLKTEADTLRQIIGG